MRLLFDRSSLSDTGWEISDNDLGIMASHEDVEGRITMLLQDRNSQLEFVQPALESFNDGKFMAQLFDVLHENGTKYKIV